MKKDKMNIQIVGFGGIGLRTRPILSDEQVERLDITMVQDEDDKILAKLAMLRPKSDSTLFEAVMRHCNNNEPKVIVIDSLSSLKLEFIKTQSNGVYDLEMFPYCQEVRLRNIKTGEVSEYLTIHYGCCAYIKYNGTRYGLNEFI